MKKTVIMVGTALILSATGSFAFAQTCASPTTIQSSGTFGGDTCAASGNETGVSAVCGGGQFTDKAAVFTWTRTSAASTHTGNIVVTPNKAGNGYDAGIGIVRSTCGSSGTCVGLFDSPGTLGSNTAETIDLSTAAFAPAATYYMFVSSFGDGTTGDTCGSFTGTVGTLPVKLQSFDIN